MLKDDYMEDLEERQAELSMLQYLIPGPARAICTTFQFAKQLLISVHLDSLHT